MEQDMGVPPSGEEWREIIGLEGYEVSSLGRVRLAGAAPRALAIDHKGYPRVNIRGKGYKVHRLVCATFHGPQMEGCEVGHLNGDRADARACNLAWVTRSENTKHSIVHGTYKRPQPPRGEAHPHAKLTAGQAREIREKSAAGQSRRALAREYGVSTTQIHRIATGEKWHV